METIHTLSSLRQRCARTHRTHTHSAHAPIVSLTPAYGMRHATGALPPPRRVRHERRRPVAVRLWWTRRLHRIQRPLDPRQAERRWRCARGVGGASPRERGRQLFDVAACCGRPGAATAPVTHAYRRRHAAIDVWWTAGPSRTARHVCSAAWPFGTSPRGVALMSMCVHALRPWWCVCAGGGDFSQ